MAHWLEIAVEVAAADAELVAELLRQHCPGGVATELQGSPLADSEGYFVSPERAQTPGRWAGSAFEANSDTAVVKAYLPADEASLRLRRSLRLAFRFAPLGRPPRWRRARRLREQDWQEGWKRYFRPRRIGRRLVVKPSWSPYRPSGSEIVIEIDPGMAFGTGQHPTTAMCLRALESLVKPGHRVLDVGTGSGILAIGAARLGARRVLALDIEPLAVKAAGENARANGVADVMEVREGTLDQGPATAERFDVIAANISGVTVERMASLMARALVPGGELVASGFLEDSAAGLSAILADNGLRVGRVMKEGVWRAIVARKPFLGS